MLAVASMYALRAYAENELFDYREPIFLKFMYGVLAVGLAYIISKCRVFLPASAKVLKVTFSKKKKKMRGKKSICYV